MLDERTYAEVMTRYWGLFGTEGQSRIRRATVAVGGLGGVGSAVALLLAKASVGRLAICDREAYGVENICQQALATDTAVGMKKADAAALECARHTRHAKIDAIVGDLTDRGVAEALIEGADAVVSALDNPEARHVLGIMCAKRTIPYVVPAAVGWSVIHTAYLPGEWAYDSQLRFMKGICMQDGYPDMTHEPTRTMIQREWQMWMVAVAGWHGEALQMFLDGKHPCNWISAPQCFFAASLGALDTLKILSGVGAPFAYPSLFCYDMKSHCIISLDEILRRRNCLHQVWEGGPEGIMKVVGSWER